MLKTFSVILTTPGEEPRHYRLASDRIDLGRTAESEIVLKVAAVSSRHCQLKKAPDGAYRLIDLGSTNGTRVNGQKVMDPEGVRLRNGDRLLFGETVEGHFVEAIEAAAETEKRADLTGSASSEMPAIWVDASADPDPEEEINPVAAAVARQQEGLLGVGSP